MSDALPKVSNKTSQVPFGRLEPSERSARTVLTHAEKYNIARSLFDPVIDRLSRLSSAKFYKQVQDWEMIITKATDAEQFVCPSTMRKAVEMNQTLAQHASLTSLLDADGYFLERGDLIDVREDLGFDEVPISAKQMSRSLTLSPVTFESKATLDSQPAMFFFQSTTQLNQKPMSPTLSHLFKGQSGT
ncbi:hypothetical protein JG687_00011242 [Phytophthora cactorum]|uniref:Uncharacterized protein n=1 Tax=Phytophthora cactorum TaxID=29920 RepID=A0A8T1U8Y7_9STRA|nr:hypothetical protein JG687_00011242 [Phytophthora cactorum]